MGDEVKLKQIYDQYDIPTDKPSTMQWFKLNSPTVSNYDSDKKLWKKPTESQMYPIKPLIIF